MKRSGIERNIVILLFVLVLIIFSFAERDSRKLDRLYKTAQLLQKKASNNVVQLPPVPGKAANN